jgi:hypothetical protein
MQLPGVLWPHDFSFASLPLDYVKTVSQTIVYVTETPPRGEPPGRLHRFVLAAEDGSWTARPDGSAPSSSSSSTTDQSGSRANSVPLGEKPNNPVMEGNEETGSPEGTPTHSAKKSSRTPTKGTEKDAESMSGGEKASSEDVGSHDSEEKQAPVRERGTDISSGSVRSESEPPPPPRPEEGASQKASGPQSSEPKASSTSNQEVSKLGSIPGHKEGPQGAPLAGVAVHGHVDQSSLQKGAAVSGGSADDKEEHDGSKSGEKPGKGDHAFVMRDGKFRFPAQQKQRQRQDPAWFKQRGQDNLDEAAGEGAAVGASTGSTKAKGSEDVDHGHDGLQRKQEERTHQGGFVGSERSNKEGDVALEAKGDDDSVREDDARAGEPQEDVFQEVVGTAGGKEEGGRSWMQAAVVTVLFVGAAVLVYKRSLEKKAVPAPLGSSERVQILQSSGRTAASVTGPWEAL